MEGSRKIEATGETEAIGEADSVKAIAANKKSREKEKVSRSDEFQAELSGFAGGKRLRMLGGAGGPD